VEVLAEYGLFLAKLITFVVAALIVIAIVISAAHRSRQEEDEGEIQVVRVNDRVRETRETLEASIQDEGARKHWLKDLRRKRKREKKEAGSKAAKRAEDSRRKRLYVVDFQGDIKASQTESLRRCVSAILSVADPQRD